MTYRNEAQKQILLRIYTNGAAVCAIALSTLLFFFMFGVQTAHATPHRIIVASGDAQQAPLNASNFSHALIVRVEDINGNGLPGVQVTFSAPSSGPSANFAVSNNNVRTTTTIGNNGVAPVVLSPANMAGSYSITATVNGTSISTTTNTFVNDPIDLTPPDNDQSSINGFVTPTSTSVQFVKFFDEPVTNNTSDDYTMVTTGTATGSVTSFNSQNFLASNSNATALTVSGISGEGTISFQLKPTTDIEDTFIGNGNGTNGHATQSANSAVHTVDFAAPDVQSIALVGSPATGATSVQYTVTFDEAANNITTDDFILTTNGTTANIASVSASSGTSVTVTVDQIANNGTLRLDLKPNTDIADNFGNSGVPAFTSGDVHTASFQPLISVSGLGQVISDGDFSASTADGTDFGLVLVDGGIVDRTFVISNPGTAPLQVTNITLGGASTGFSITSPTTATVAPGQTTDVTVRFDPTNTATRSPNLIITSNVSGTNGTYSFRITGTGNAPAISVSGLGQVITDPSLLPSSANGTDFGSVAVASGQVDRTFVISNPSTLPLVISSIIFNGANTGFSFTSPTTGITVPAGSSTNLGIRFDPSTSGTEDPIVRINSNSSNSLYQFRIEGTGTGSADTTPPVVQSIALVGSPAANATSVQYTVTFDEVASNITTDDFSLTTSGTTANIVSVSASTGANVTVTVDTIAGNGTLRLDLKSGTDIADAAGNSGVAAFTGGDVHTSSFEPLISVSGLGQVIADDDDMPSTTDGTDFGALAVNGGVLERTFVISNSGTAPLEITDISFFGNSSPFNITSPTTVTIPAGGTTDLTIEFDPTTSSPRSTDVRIDSNAANSRFVFGITGSGVFPTLSVSGLGQPIADSIFTGTASPVNGTDFGSVTAGGGTVNRTFVLSNSSTVPLNISSIVFQGGAGDFTITSATSLTIAPGGTGNLVINYSPSSNAPSSSIVKITSDAQDTSYSFNIVGAALQPAISISGLGQTIADEDQIPDMADGTDFGTVIVQGGTVDRTFVISNPGAATLEITSISFIGVNTGFTITSPTTLTIPAGETRDLTIRFDPQSTSLINPLVTIQSNAPNDAGTYRFGIAGQGSSDTTPPVVQSIALVGSPAATATTVQYTVTFDENANNISTDDFSLTRTGSANGNVTSVSMAAGNSVTVTVSNFVGEGSIRLDLNANTDITDNIGNGGGTNGNVAAFTTGEVHTLDVSDPDVTINGVPANSNAPFTATFDFGEAVNGFILTDITLVNASASNFTGSDGDSVYTALITPIATGNVDVSVAANVASDLAGNANTDSGIRSSTFTAPSPEPEIRVNLGGGEVQSGASTNFGASGSSVSAGFSVENIGNANLVLGAFEIASATHPADITILSQPSPTTIAPGQISNGTADFEILPATITGGTRSVTFRINSNDQDESQFLVTVSYTAVNSEPNASAGSSFSVASGTANVGLDGSASSDANTGQTLTFQWTQLQGTSVTINNPTSATPTFDAPTIIPGGADQTLVFQLEVSDGIASDTATVNATITAPAAVPDILVTNQPTITEFPSGATASTANGTDFGDQGLGFQADSSIFFANIVMGTTLTINSFQFTGPAAGDYSAVLSATPFDVVNSGGQLFSGIGIQFTPTQAGPRNAQFIINSNDPDEGTFIINLTGNGVAVNSVATAGTPQTTPVGNAFSTNLEVTVRDASNNPISGALVTFSAPTSGASGTFAGGGSTAGFPTFGIATTNASGVATSPTFTANTAAGNYNVVATVTLDNNAAPAVAPVNFNLTNSAGAAATLSADSGGGQSTLVNAAFNAPIFANVADVNGNPVSGVTVNFTAPGAGASAVLSATSAVTDANGQASVTATANGDAGTYNVVASSAGLADVNFALTNTTTLPDTVAPTAVITTPSNKHDGITPFVATVTFSEPVVGFADGELTATNASVGALTDVGGAGTTFTATITPESPLDIVLGVAANVAADAAGNQNTAANDLTVEGFIVEHTQRVIATFLQNRANHILSNQPDITGFIKGSNLSGGGPAGNLVLNATTESQVLAFSTSRSKILAGLKQAEQRALSGIAQQSATTSDPLSILATQASSLSDDRLVEERLSQRRGHDDNNNAVGGSYGFAGDEATLQTGAELLANQPQAADVVLDESGNALSTQPNRAGTWDVWTEIYGSNGTAGASDSSLWVGYLGAHYFLDDNTLVGVLGQIDWADETNSEFNSRVDGVGFLIGPYIAGQFPGQNLFYEARASWGASDNDVSPIGTYVDNFDTTRFLASGKLSGSFAHGNYTIAPEFSVSYFEDTQHSYTDTLGNLIPEQTVSLGEVRFGPDISQNIVLDDGTLLTPSVGLSGVMNFGIAENAASQGFAFGNDDFRARIDAGFSATNPDNGLSLTLEGFYDGIGVDNFETYGGRARVTVRLN